MAIENIDIIEQSFGLEKGKLTEMMSSEETHKIDIDNFVIKPKSDYEALLNNLKKESSTAAVEIAVKNARKDLGLEFEGKTMENLLKFYKEKVETEAKIDPNKKYDTLKSDFDKLQGNLSEWESKYTNLENTYKQKEQLTTINNTLLKSIPDNTTIPKEDVLAIMKARVQFNIGEDGFEIIGKDGNPMKNDANRNLITAEEFVSDFIKPYLKEVQGGAGGGDSSNSGKATSFDLFDKRMADKGINVGSERYNDEMSIAMKNGTLKL
mgnify:FL=1|jgi:hypothetical protein